MSGTNIISQPFNDTSSPRASGGSDVPNESDEDAQSAANGGDNKTESSSNTPNTTHDPSDPDVIDGKKDIRVPETLTFPTEQKTSTLEPEAQREAGDSHSNNESVDDQLDGVEDSPVRLNQTVQTEPGRQMNVDVETISTAEGGQETPETEDEEKQTLSDEQAKDPVQTPTTDPPSSYGGVQDVPPEGVQDVPPEGVQDVPPEGVQDVPPEGVQGVPPEGVQDVPPEGVQDVPPEGVEDVPDGRRIHSSRPKQPKKEGDEQQDEEPEVQSTGTKFMFIGILGVVLSISYAVWLQPKSEVDTLEVSRVDVFLLEMNKVQVQFPSQHVELWRRSKIHLKRHLQTDHPKEPASLILTAGRRAERTLHCLAQGLASALSSALNGSVLQIDGDSMAGQDSSQVKFDIDDKLRRAFEGDQPVAVIHRFEELPPGSTIIFYRYCDHENAAYKSASLIFTVLLEGEEEVSASLGLSVVEEMVDDHLKDKFLSSDHPAAFDSMDTDKLSGLWSRISHLILPVAAEERIEQHGCGGT